MNDLIGRVFDFEKRVFPSNDLYAKLAVDGQSPKALIISCADSRVVPELIMQAEPGDLFVCRNAGNIVPPFATQNGGVSSTVEYAVLALVPVSTGLLWWSYLPLPPDNYAETFE